jgi:hypothetical protein
MHANSLRTGAWWRLPAILALALLGYMALSASAVARPAPYGRATAAAAPGVPCSSISFATPVTYYVGTRPRSATGGDFNRDNNPDVVVSDYSSRTVSILLGNADGTFQPGVSYAVGFHPVAIAVGDFNEDNKADLVVANYDSGDVTVLLGNGDGTFQPGTSFPSNIGAYGVAVGDFNEDTHLDAATSNVNFGTINVLLGNGNGTLQAPVPYAAGLRPQVIAVGHFNADSHVDLVVPNYTASTVSVFFGNGDGTFQSAAARPVTPFADYVTVADMNHDGKDDLVLSHYTTSDNIGVALGNGDGTFASEVTYTTGATDPTFAAVGDFNGDGIPDLSSPGYLNDIVSVLLGNGNGTFQPAVSFPDTAGSNPVAVVPGDFNHDGRLDMLTANEHTDNVSVFISNCPVTTPTPTSSTPTLTPTRTPTPSCRPWQLVPSANVSTFASYLYGVSAASSNDIWAAGNYFNGSGYSQTLIEHWDGSTWSVVPSPNPGAHNNWLFGVAATSANDAWAVGWQASTNIQQPLILHWDGTSWTNFTVSVTRPRVVLQAISAVSQNDIWAVGLSCETALCDRRITAALHYNGTAWSVVDSPNPGSFDNSFASVVAVSSSDVWAVGEACTGNGCASSQSLAEHWDGSTWNLVASPSPGTGRTPLLGVDAQAGNAWAVGEACTDGGCTAAQSVTIHWNGTSWNLVSSPNPGSVDTHLNAVAISSAGDVWAVGSESSDGTAFGNAVLHWNGSAWSTISVTGPGSLDDDLRGLARLSPTNIWAVGDFDNAGGERTQVQHYSGPCATSTSTPTPVSASATATRTSTSTSTATATPTRTASLTPTRTATSPPNSTATPTPTSTPTGTSTPRPATGTPTNTVTPCTIGFSDVRPADYFYEPVRYLYCHGAVSGYNDNTFRPFNNTTRGQLAKIVVLAQGWTIYTPPSPTFRDVPATDAFYGYVETAYNHGIISGYACGAACLEYRPGTNVTRGQLAKIVVLARAWTIYTPPSPTFTDVPAANAFYQYIETAYSHNIISGYSCGASCLEFRPGNNATRGQIAKIVYLAVTLP